MLKIFVLVEIFALSFGATLWAQVLIEAAR